MSPAPNNPSLVASSPGLYYIDKQTWQVGERYTLLHVLGRGSFSAVCLAIDHQRQQQVALKRIGNVLSSPENAKRVLREVCILRRLHHPNIISISNAFLTPSATGALVYRNGKFINTSLDIYLALEYCEAGDLFMMRGQLPEADAQQLMWQLLEAVKYLHANNVWHRDIKSSNVLVTVRDGRRVAKVADFGSARSAMAPLSKEDAEVLDSSCHGRSSLSGDPRAAIAAAGGLVTACTMHNSESMQADLDASDHPLRARPSGGPAGGYQQPLTRVVCTPCYRAPEVILSRGGYSSAIDMWSVGCVFGELLHRVYRLHQSAIPNLQVAPVFAVTGLPLTPTDGDRFEGHVGSAATHAELDALFKVIGTPAWACIEGVANSQWRRYLFRIRPRAPTLFRRFGVAGEPAVDLLSRLLTFDPSRRCCAEEAMAHEFFDQLKLTEMMSEHDIGRADLAEDPSSIAASMLLSSSTAANAGTAEQLPCTHGNGVHTCPDQQLAAEPPDGMMDVDTPITGVVSRPRSDSQQPGVPPLLSTGLGSPTAKRTCTRMVAQASQPTKPCQHPRFHEIADAAAALAALEVELAALFATSTTDGTERLREMLQRECDELAHQGAEMLKEYHIAAAAALTEQQHSGQLAQAAGSGESLSPRHNSGNGVAGSGGSFGAAGGGSFGAGSLPSETLGSVSSHLSSSHPSGIPTGASPLSHTSGMSGGGPALTPASFYGSARTAHDHLRRFSPLPRRDSLPKLDPGQHIDASEAGRERITHCADAESAHLLPEKHLKAGRHGEWVHVATPAGPKAGPQWGVTLLPPGIDPDRSDAMMDVIRSQHAR